ncbi:hypothetical protein AAFP30_15415 [Gordonia sp. CPCC 205515]|uniref:hypothetical protein n=1 Tax=Gordonia sp. CPCC 205515 TaxID=3140791 RepID=UPI003AF381D9
MAGESVSGDASGTGSSGSSGDATDSRPISVSELLARSREAGTPAVTPREGRGRRRVGREGAVSVSELTGEIPRIETGPFPRSANPVARRYSEDTPVAEPPSGPQRPAATGRAVPSNASGMPTYDAPPATRDFSAAAVSQRVDDATTADRADVDEESANAVTRIIPIVEDERDDLVVVEPDDIEGVDLAAAPAPAEPRSENGPPETIEDFDAYRNFSDVETVEEPAAKRSFLDRFRRKPKPPAPSRAQAARERAEAADAAATDDAVGTEIPAPTAPTAAVTAATVAPAIVPEPEVDDAPTSLIIPHVDDRPDTDGPHAVTPHVADVEQVEQDDFAAPDVAEPNLEAPASEVTIEAEDASRPDEVTAEAVDETVAEPIVAEEPSDPTPAVTVAAETAETEADTVEAIDPDTVETASVTPSPDEATTADQATTAATVREPVTDTPTTDTPAAEKAKATGERSPGMAWLLILGESLAGLAIGVGLFWGFTELWKWNVYFALVLAVLVIFGIVTFTHLVRHSRDLITTLLALGVGLIVTIGPLVLLAT